MNYEIINEIPYTQNNKQDFRQLEDIGKVKVLNIRLNRVDRKERSKYVW